MQEIKDILKTRFVSFLNEHKGYFIIWKTSKFWKMLVKYNIYNKDFRMVYQWNFRSVVEWKYFIDKNEKILNSVSNI